MIRLELTREKARAIADRLGDMWIKQGSPLLELQRGLRASLGSASESADGRRLSSEGYEVTLREELSATIADGTDDEIRVLLGFARQLFGEGRQEYGPLCLETETRSLIELLGDLVGEGYDRTFYTICAMFYVMQAERGK